MILVIAAREKCADKEGGNDDVENHLLRLAGVYVVYSCLAHGKETAKVP